VAEGSLQLGDKEVVSCPICGGVVPPSKGFKPRKYCSAKCLRAAYRTPIERPKNCRQCGEPFRDLCVKGPPRVFCKKCLRVRRPPPRSFPKECRRCGKEFSSPTRRAFCSDECRYYNSKCRKGSVAECKTCGASILLQGHRRVYCSRACRGLASRTGIREPRPCLRCGKHFSPGPYRNSGKFCSRGCAFLALREGHPKAREAGRARGGGRSIKARCEHYGAPYTPIQKAEIFKRFSWTCQICGCTLLRAQTRTEQGKIDPRSPTVDHIIPVSLGPASPGHVWGNVQAACRRCNIKKGASVPATPLPDSVKCR
jgi:hypothetical protein